MYIFEYFLFTLIAQCVRDIKKHKCDYCAKMKKFCISISRKYKQRVKKQLRFYKKNRTRRENVKRHVRESFRKIEQFIDL